MIDYALFFGIFSLGMLVGAISIYAGIWLAHREELPRAPVIRSE